MSRGVERTILPKPFYLDIESRNERFDFSIAQKKSSGLYAVIASVAAYVKAPSALGSRLLGVPPSSDTGRWVPDHVFKHITVENKEGERITLIPDVFETMINNYIYIFKNAHSCANVGDNLIIYVEHF